MWRRIDLYIANARRHKVELLRAGDGSGDPPHHPDILGVLFVLRADVRAREDSVVDFQYILNWTGYSVEHATRFRGHALLRTAARWRFPPNAIRRFEGSYKSLCVCPLIDLHQIFPLIEADEEGLRGVTTKQVIHALTYQDR
jgi:hypothetical protein